MEGVDLCWAEESHKLSQRSIDLLLPTIRKEGSQFYFTLNPELDTDEVWVRFIENKPDNCVVRDCSYHNNPWFPAVLEEERQQFLRMVESGARSQADYDWVWEGRCKPAVDGAIFAPQIAQALQERRLCHVPHNPELLTHLVWDLGYSGMMTIGFVQKQGSSVHLIDYIEDSHRLYSDYVRQIRGKVSDHGYRIAIDGAVGGKAWLPHDGKQTRPEIGKSPIVLLNELGLSAPKDGIPDIGIKGRIEAARQMFPRVVFDKERCSSLFNRLRRYAMKQNTDDHSVSIKKDGNDHAGDMFTEIAVIEKELTNETYDMMPLNHFPKGIV
jgi:phage terminase large subunit